MLDDIGDDLMEEIDLVPLRLDFASLLFELDKQSVSHDDDVDTSVEWIRLGE